MFGKGITSRGLGYQAALVEVVDQVCGAHFRLRFLFGKPALKRKGQNIGIVVSDDGFQGV
jgi:hypothetical protein